MTRIHLGISVSPSDTFAFHAILTGRIDTHGLEFAPELLEIQRLDERLAEGDFDIARGSCFAGLMLANELGMLPTGAIAGVDNGPLLLAAAAGTRPRDMIFRDGKMTQPTVVCPGQLNTGYLLYRLFHPDQGVVTHGGNAEILSRLKDRAADFGIGIGASRFSYTALGLACVEDLGVVWEYETDLPLPIEAILVRHGVAAEVQTTASRVIRNSIQYALENRDEALATSHKHAPELPGDVIDSCIDSYVNQLTVDWGSEGRQAVQELASRARAAGILAADHPPLLVHEM